MQKYLDKFNGWWYCKSHEQRQKYIRNTVVALAALTFVVGKTWSENRTKEATKVVDTAEPTSEVQIVESPEIVLEQDMVELAKQSVNKEVTASLKQLEDAKPVESTSDGQIVGEKVPQEPQVRLDMGDLRFPSPVTTANAQNDPFGYGDQSTPVVETVEVQQQQQEPETWTWEGGTESGNASPSDYGSLIAESSDQPKNKVIDLPVGFMKARLLVGINAQSGEFGQNNPQQLVFMVQAPAQLPNKMKMDLKGCWAVTNAHGDLSSGRIEALPVTMTCLTQNGDIAEAKGLKGFVQDQDGKRGLDARVVSRARHVLASSLLARTVEAFGSVGAASSMVTSNSALGSVQSVDSDKILQNAGATGLEGAAGDLGDYLLEMAKNINPTMEHGAGKDVLLWLAETAEMEIRELRK